MEEDKNSNRTAYDQYWVESNTRERANSENYDKAILYLASGGMIFSLNFLSKTSHHIQHKWLLITSWGLFVASVLFVLLSFLFGQCAIRKKLDYAEQYLLKGKDEFRDKIVLSEIMVSAFNLISGICYFLAIFSSMIYASINL
jgi:hypothetical protein